MDSLDPYRGLELVENYDTYEVFNSWSYSKNFWEDRPSLTELVKHIFTMVPSLNHFELNAVPTFDDDDTYYQLFVSQLNNLNVGYNVTSINDINTLFLALHFDELDMTWEDLLTFFVYFDQTLMCHKELSYQVPYNASDDSIVYSFTREGSL